MKIGISLPVREMKNDLGAIREFAQSAEELGYTHLRVPDQIIRKDSGHLHEPMMLLSYIAAITKTIELVPSVIILPSRQTALFAKQAAQLDLFSGGRIRIGIGVGGNKDEYAALGKSFKNRGARCDEQIKMLRQLWTEPSIDFVGEFENIPSSGIDPLPIQQPIPIWIGGRAQPVNSVVKRIGELSDGWFVLCPPDEFVNLKSRIDSYASTAGREPNNIGTEAGVAVVGPRESEWQDRVSSWNEIGLTHLCLRTLGGNLTSSQHLKKIQEISNQIPL